MTDILNYLNNHYILLFLCIGLLIMIFAASKIDKNNKRILISIIIAILILAAFEFLETLFDSSRVKEENFFRYLFSSLSYILRPVIIVLFYRFKLDFKDKKRYLIWIGVIVNTVVYILELFAYKNPSMQFVVWYDANNHFHRNWLGYTCHVVSAIYLIIVVIDAIYELVVKKTRKEINYIIIIIISMVFLIQIIGLFVVLDNNFTSETFAIGTALYFIYLSYDKVVSNTISHEREMQEKTTSLMLSQIQPHFIYNTLATIRVLCEIDPEQAAKTIDDFSKYLRINTDALSKTEPVLITDEVNHAMAYSKIEMLRFDNIKVLFDIQDDDFKLPVLTIQPMVENAIKYGVRAREEGIINVKTYKSGKNHILVIEDNGTGFDVDKVFTDGKNHVGIMNVKTRIINMVNGTFNVESESGKGTIVTITIPEEE